MSTRVSLFALSAIVLGATALTPVDASAMMRYGSGHFASSHIGPNHFASSHFGSSHFRPSHFGYPSAARHFTHVPTASTSPHQALRPRYSVTATPIVATRTADVTNRVLQARPCPGNCGAANPPSTVAGMPVNHRLPSSSLAWSARLRIPLANNDVRYRHPQAPAQNGAANAAGTVGQPHPVNQAGTTPSYGNGGTIFGNNVGHDPRRPDYNSTYGTQYVPSWVPSGGYANTDGPRVNLPGSQRQPGFGVGNLNGGFLGLNQPGATYQHGPNDVDRIRQQMAASAGGLVNQATQGGFNNLNIPSQVTPGTDVSDNTSGGRSTSTVTRHSDGSYTVTNTGPSSNGTTSTVTVDVSGRNIQPVSNIPGVNVGSATFTNPEPGMAAGAAASAEGLGQAVAGGPAASAATAPANTSGLFDIPKPVKQKDKKNGSTPNDDATTTSTAGGLAVNNPYVSKNNGGGTDNNTETNAGTMGGLSPNSAYARRTQGDGGPSDAGDNNHISDAGALASGSAYARRNNGDGDNDSRGGNVASSIINPGAAVHTPGAGHNTAPAAATAVRAN